MVSATLGIEFLTQPSVFALSAYQYLSSEAITPEIIEKRSTKDWVIVDLNESEAFRFWGLDILSQSKSTILVGVSSDFIFVATIYGDAQISSNKTSFSVEAGQVAIQQHFSTGGVRIETFSAHDLKTAFEKDAKSLLVKAINPVVKKQKKSRFWGTLRGTNANIGTPTRSDIEALRRTYLVNSTIISIKRKVKNVRDLPEEVAKTFILAAKKRDVQVVADLLDPSSFRDAAKEGKFIKERTAFAEKIINQKWVDKINSPIVFEKTNNPLQLVFNLKSDSFVVQLAIFDTGVFVTSIDSKS